MANTRTLAAPRFDLKSLSCDTAARPDWREPNPLFVVLTPSRPLALLAARLQNLWAPRRRSRVYRVTWRNSGQRRGA